MKNIVPSYNPNSGNLEIKVELNLLTKYFANFEGLIAMNKELSDKGFSVKRENPTTAIVSIPVESGINMQWERGLSIAMLYGTMLLK